MNDQVKPNHLSDDNQGVHCTAHVDYAPQSRVSADDGRLPPPGRQAMWQLIDNALAGAVEPMLRGDICNILAPLLVPHTEPTAEDQPISDDDLLKLADKAFGQVVDYDLRGNPITDYRVLTIGAYGPAIRRLVALARKHPVPIDQQPVRLPARKEYVASSLDETSEEGVRQWNLAITALEALGPLYNHADVNADEVKKLCSTIEDLEMALDEETRRADNAGSNASAFEDRMGNLQVQNGKLQDKLSALSVQRDECKDLIQRSLAYHGDFSWKNPEGAALMRAMQAAVSK